MYETLYIKGQIQNTPHITKERKTTKGTFTLEENYTTLYTERNAQNLNNTTQLLCTAYGQLAEKLTQYKKGDIVQILGYYHPTTPTPKITITHIQTER